MLYADAKALWEKARDKSRGAQFLRRSRADARIIQTRNGFGLRIYNTIIVEWLPNGNVVIDNGGFQTVTTREWINAALGDFPFKGRSMYVQQKDYRWYVGGTRRVNRPKVDKWDLGYDIVHRELVPFHRHLVITKRGRIILPAQD